MAAATGRFCWYELMTSDTAAAGKFYGEVVGWDLETMPGPMEYTLWKVGETGVGGMMAMPQDMCDVGAQTGWIGYIAVDDVDAYTARVAAKGGQTLRAPDDIPNVGRFSVVADPQGAAFVLFKPSSTEEPPLLPVGTPGRPAWRELMAADGATAFDWYADMFGWTKGDAHDMGPMGVYQLFDVDGESAGGMMTKPPEIPATYWGYYFNVDSINAATVRVKAAGGQVLMGPMEVPGGDWVINAIDPQGGHFGLVGPNT